MSLEERKFNLEIEKARFERRFFNRNLGAILTTIVSVSAIIFSIFQFATNKKDKEQELELKAMEILIKNYAELFNDDSYEKREKIRATISGVFPQDVAGNILGRLEQKNFYLHELGTWSRSSPSENRRKSILLMDSAHQVYKGADAFRKTNADDIFEILKGLDIRIIRAMVDTDWAMYSSVFTLKPSLIVIHMSAFERPKIEGTCGSPESKDKEGGQEKGEYNFERFLEQINRHMPKTKLLVYSRRNDLPNRMSALQARFSKLTLEYLQVKPDKAFVFNTMKSELLPILDNSKILKEHDSGSEKIRNKILNHSRLLESYLSEPDKIDFSRLSSPTQPELYDPEISFKITKFNDGWILEEYTKCDGEPFIFRKFVIEKSGDELKVYEFREVDFRNLDLALLLSEKINKMIYHK